MVAGAGSGKSLKRRSNANIGWLPVGLLMLFIAVIGIRTLPDYGISWDEYNHIREVQELFDYFQDGTPLPEEQGHYGQLFNILGEVAYRGAVRFHSIDPEEEYRAPYARAYVRHVLSFFSSLITCVLLVMIVRRVAGSSFAIIGPAILMLMPRFWGHSFYNSKDIPLAAAFTLISLAAPIIAYRISQADRTIFAAAYFTLFGVLIGIGSATRLGLAVCLGLLPLILLVMDPGRIRLRTVLLWMPLYSLTIFAWLVTTVALHPASYETPVSWIRETLTYFSNHPYEATVRFEGQDLVPSELPRRYGATYVWLTTPLLWLLAALAGIVTAIMRWSSHTGLRRGFFLALLFQIFALPAYAFIRHSSLYDGMRHILFVIPALAVFSAYGITAIGSTLNVRGKFLYWTLTGIYALSVATEMHELHPYEATYFQEAVGGLRDAGHDYDADYWGLSMREAIEWVNVTADSGEVVVIGGNLNGARVFVDWSLTPLSLDRYRESSQERAGYYVGLKRWDYAEEFPDCPIVHAVSRQKIPLSVVKRISRSVKPEAPRENSSPGDLRPPCH